MLGYIFESVVVTVARGSAPNLAHILIAGPAPNLRGCMRALRRQEKLRRVEGEGGRGGVMARLKNLIEAEPPMGRRAV